MDVTATNTCLRNVNAHIPWVFQWGHATVFEDDVLDGAEYE